jgi:peptidoglycan-associated lipoprotein
MNSIRRSVGLLSVVTLVAFGAACSKKPAATAPAVQPTPAPSAPPTTVTSEKPFEPTTAKDSTVDALPADIAKINAAGYLKDVFFDFDKAEVRDDGRDALAKDAEWLKKYPTIRFRIEGHCDERGTREYNLALGERRANAAKEYLASLGIDASRIETVSYGKERPFDPGHDEGAWSKNRRAHFLVTAK